MVIFCDGRLLPVVFGVLQNLAFIFTLISLFLHKFSGNYLEACSKDYFNPRGISFFAIVIILSMLAPVRLSEIPNIAIDFRIGIIVLATNYLRITDCLIVAIISILYRVVLGGSGWIPWTPVALLCIPVSVVATKFFSNKLVSLTIACIICTILALLSLATASLVNDGFVYVSPFLNSKNFIILTVTMIICNPLAAVVLERAIVCTLKYKKDFDDLTIKATMDAMTGLYNYRCFKEYLTRLEIKARSNNKSLSILMLDIDRFKIYNDRFGHQSGDRLLFELGKIFLSTVREGDVVARYGGEEFAILLPDTTKEGALVIAERIRAQVEEYNFQGKEAMPYGKVTISIGVASIPIDALDGEELIRLADTALYRAKDKGRNRVELVGEF